MSKSVKLYQIFYNEASRRALDPGFSPLDNTANPRPDWSEYWPIRQTLKNTRLDPDSFVGFFSPRFGQKTGLTAQDILNVVESQDADAYSFSPHPDMAVVFRNPIEHGDFHHAGFLSLMRELRPRLGLDVGLDGLVQDNRRTIFCNFVVAKPWIWSRWLTVCEKLFEICEANKEVLAHKLNANTRYQDSIRHPMKVFVMERMISLVLEQHRVNAVYGLDFEAAPFAYGGLNQHRLDIKALEVIKRNYVSTGDRKYLAAYDRGRRQLIDGVPIMEEICQYSDALAMPGRASLSQALDYLSYQPGGQMVLARYGKERLAYMKSWLGDSPIDALTNGVLEPWATHRFHAGESIESLNEGVQLLNLILDRAANAWINEYGQPWLRKPYKLPALVTVKTRHHYEQRRGPEEVP